LSNKAGGSAKASSETGTGCGRKYVAGVASDQLNSTNYKHQNNRWHHRVLGDVLALVVQAQLSKKMTAARFYTQV
jgi:hypothetical protein